MNKHCEMSNADYHNDPAISKTVLSSALKSARAYKRAIDGNFEMSDSMALGDAVHAAVLEPERFESMYELSKNKSGNTELKPKIDIPKITPAQYEKFLSMTKALNECEEFQKILSTAMKIEHSFFANVDGEDLKCRPDILIKSGWIVDLKTVGGMDDNPSEPESFARSMFDFGYDIQAYHYPLVVSACLGKPVKGMIFVCVDSKKEDSGVKIYKIPFNEDSEWHQIGKRRWEQAMEKVKLYRGRKEFPVYENVVETDEPPLPYNAYKFAQAEGLLESEEIEV